MGVIGIRFNYRQILVAACTLIAVFAIAAPASAENCGPTQGQYGDSSNQLGACGQTGSGNTADPGNSGNSGDPASSGLPFTGLDLGLMGVAAVALLGGGLVLRQRARAEEDV
jgi:hypothetical protein